MESRHDRRPARHPPSSLPRIACSVFTSCWILKCSRIRTRCTTNCGARTRCTGIPFCTHGSWTRYSDVVHVLHHFSANRTPTPEQLSALNLSALNPIAEVMVRQMLFLDPPDHTRLRAPPRFRRLHPRRVEKLRSHIQEVMDTLLDRVVSQGTMDVIADFAGPGPGDRGPPNCWVYRRATMFSLGSGRKISPRCLATSNNNPERFPRVLRMSKTCGPISA